MRQHISVNNHNFLKISLIPLKYFHKEFCQWLITIWLGLPESICQWVGVLNFTFSFHFQWKVCSDMQIFHMQEPVKEKINHSELTLILWLLLHWNSPKNTDPILQIKYHPRCVQCTNTFPTVCNQNSWAKNLQWALSS